MMLKQGMSSQPEWYIGCQNKVIKLLWYNITYREAAIRSVLWKKVSLKIAQYSQENTCV